MQVVGIQGRVTKCFVCMWDMPQWCHWLLVFCAGLCRAADPQP
jgi:hypothetical protein